MQRISALVILHKRACLMKSLRGLLLCSYGRMSVFCRKTYEQIVKKLRFYLIFQGRRVILGAQLRGVEIKKRC